MSVNERFLILMKALDFYPSSFAKEIGVSQPSIKQVIDGENLPSAKVLIPLLEKFPNVNANWLLVGEGEMFLKAVPTLDNKIEDRDKAIKKLEQSVEDLRSIIDLQKKALDVKEKENRNLLDDIILLKQTIKDKESTIKKLQENIKPA